MAKGLLSKSPSIVIPDRVDFIHDKDYSDSFLDFGHKRPLNALEISHLVSLMETKELLKTLNLGYGQVVKSEKIKKHISEAKQTADKQLSGLGSFLDDEDLPLAVALGNLVTNSTESPQSDKLILAHTTVAISFIIAEYGLALSTTSRKDLIAAYSKYIIELLSLSRDGADLMIECGWLERIPETPDRKKLFS